MENPRMIIAVKPGAEYSLPTYSISDVGVEDGPRCLVKFCKGDKNNPDVFRQPGFFTESIIQLAKEYLESVNVGEMATRDTSMAITKLDEALMWINKRSEDRKLRGVQATYKK